MSTPESKQPLSPDNTKIGSKVKKAEKKTVAQINHDIKVELMRTCMIYGKSYETTLEYFKLKGYKLSKTTFVDLRKELTSHGAAQKWFSDEALFAMEEDHKLSIERIRMMENRLLEEFEQLAATSYYKYIKQEDEEKELIKNKAHDTNALIRVISQFQSLQETKNKMFSATPLVQEIMEVHARQEEEDSKPKAILKKEKGMGPIVTD